MRIPIIVSAIFITAACGSSQSQTEAQFQESKELSKHTDFNSYWYGGNAELSSYQLRQMRYGEWREGSEVMIFVTEDFSKSKQVKLDNPSQNAADKVPVLKLNRQRKFDTGIYDYVMMYSTFNSALNGQLLKETCSSLDWCGQSFSQINRDADTYSLAQLSYFESEGDRKISLEDCIIEDGLWSQIRLDPKSLPIGKIACLPSLFYIRLLHKENKAYNAEASLTEGASEGIYRITYPDLGRTVSINFESAFPYKILSWKESQDGELLSEGKLNNSMREAYWMLNGEKDYPYREKLGL